MIGFTPFLEVHFPHPVTRRNVWRPDQLRPRLVAMLGLKATAASLEWRGFQ